MSVDSIIAMSAAPGCKESLGHEHLDTPPTIRVVAMPKDTNPYGDIFGGWLMGQMDLAANTVAEFTSFGRSATVAADDIVFIKPVAVGDEVSIWASLVGRGRTSMKIDVEAWKRSRKTQEYQKVATAHFVYVALDEHGTKRPIK